MSSLHIADVEVVIREHRAANGADEDGAILQAHLFQGFRNQLVSHAVAAARTIMGLLLEIAFTIVEIVEHRRLGMHCLVFVG